MQFRQATQIVRDWLPGFMAGAASYLYVWLNPRTYDLLPWAVLSAGGGLLAASLTRAKMHVVLGSALLGATGLNAAHIVFDLAADATSHNLFPLELGSTFAVTAAGAIVGIALVRTAARLTGYLRLFL